ncbi:xanthine dehydrogenase small subunit [Snodgrassella sp. CFCC 13594]|uniref:xanthine dehydrogenase small subunit n=1 Tax=Snodgrassella sp. CFCC 13594 TaxID=1775559 RepID=UPI0008371507|nr:xanthine dehydrogenase small subunit [Snodgrassella sp. CFCC 13594]
MTTRGITFYFRGLRTEVRDAPPTMTVLQFLREYQHDGKLAATGTKEGCAEGDCGACTVVLAELRNGRLQVHSVNACIQFLPTLDRKALFTVEDLRILAESAGSPCHPVQQAMVDHHGSQCGFCTPGFVMSLFSLYENETQAPTRDTVMNYVSGNLCRCTGYRPIVDAAQAAIADYPQVALNRAQLVADLQLLADLPELDYEYGGGLFYAPTSLPQLAARKQAHPQARLLSGGTDVGLWVTKQSRVLPALIYIGQVTELQKIQENDTELVIGAGVSLRQAWQVIVRHYPQLATLARRFASMPIQNAGTLVGNIANGSPIGDSMPILMAIDASLDLQCGDTVRQLPLVEFYLGYQRNALVDGEFIKAVRIPWPLPGLRYGSDKIAKRYEQDISAVCAAFSLILDEHNRITHIRIAYGGMAAIPKRAHKAEAVLLGATWTSAVIEAAQHALTEDFQPLSDARASSGYRLQVAQNALWRFYLSQQQEHEPLSVFALSEEECR